MSEFDGEWTKRQPDGWEDNGEWQPLDEEPQPESPKRFRRCDIAIGLGLLASIGVLGYGVTHSGKNLTKSLKPKDAPAPLTASCPQPSQKAISTVERLFTEPVAKARSEYRQLSLDGYEAEGSGILPNLWGTTGEELLYYTRPYFKKYKIDVEVASAAENPGYGLHTPTAAELDSQNMSSNVLGLVAGLSDVAPHYTLMSGLRKIRLVAGKSNTEFVWDEPHTLYWNIDSSEPNADPVPFELGIALGHFTEDRMCGQDGVDNDPAFQSLSEGPFASPLALNDSIYKAEGQTTEHIATLDEYHDGKATPDDVKVIDQRAIDELATDKAELLALVADPARVWSVMSPDHPVLRAKAIEALAELYRVQPAVVRRLAVKASRYPYSGPTTDGKPAGSRQDIVFKNPNN